jgi:hypothetical protein
MSLEILRKSFSANGNTAIISVRYRPPPCFVIVFLVGLLEIILCFIHENRLKNNVLTFQSPVVSLAAT